MRAIRYGGLICQQFIFSLLKSQSAMRAIRYGALLYQVVNLHYLTSQSAMRAIRYGAEKNNARLNYIVVAIRYACN